MHSTREKFKIYLENESLMVLQDLQQQSLVRPQEQYDYYFRNKSFGYYDLIHKALKNIRS